jgi:hypothetical protein
LDLTTPTLAVGEILVLKVFHRRRTWNSEFLSKNPNTLPVTCCLDKARMNALPLQSSDDLKR